jgi:SAM-dependent methyltransferase
MRRSFSRILKTLLVALCLIVASVPSAISAQAPTPQQLQIYETFRDWITRQPASVQRADDAVVYKQYEAALLKQGKSSAEAAATIATLKKLGDRAEVERWNQILTAAKPAFNTAPNAFLVEMVKGLKPGRSLDVGMGQGRNTIFLAQQGWDSVGFDPAERAVAAAEEHARAVGVKITTHIARAEDFEWGAAQWDLIVVCYVGGRELVPQIRRSLRPGGMLVLEAFHRDATKARPIGGAVVFDSNELLRIFSALRIIRYEDTPAVGDFGLADTRVVRLAAIKD